MELTERLRLLELSGDERIAGDLAVICRMLARAEGRRLRGVLDVRREVRVTEQFKIADRAASATAPAAQDSA